MGSWRSHTRQGDARPNPLSPAPRRGARRLAGGHASSQEASPTGPDRQHHKRGESSDNRLEGWPRTWGRGAGPAGNAGPLLAASSPDTGASTSAHASTGARSREAAASEPGEPQKGTRRRADGLLNRAGSRLSGPEEARQGRPGARPQLLSGAGPSLAPARYSPCRRQGGNLALEDATAPLQLQRRTQFRGGASTCARGRAAAGSPAPTLDAAA